MRLIHKSNNLGKEQVILISQINDLASIDRPFLDTVKEMQTLLDGHNLTIKEATPLGENPEFEFTLSAFFDDKEIYIAESPTGEDFYIISL